MSDQQTKNASTTVDNVAVATTTNGNSKNLINTSKDPMEKSALTNTLKSNNAMLDDVEDEEDVEYEEYEVDEDEEIEDDAIVVKNPSQQQQQPKPQTQQQQKSSQPTVAKASNVLDEDEYEEEEVEYEDEEEVEYEDEECDNDEDDPMANKIDELINKTCSLKQDTVQSKTNNENKLSNIVTSSTPIVQPLTPPSSLVSSPKTITPTTTSPASSTTNRPFVLDDQLINTKNSNILSNVGTLPSKSSINHPFNPANMSSNLGSMKHASNKWDIANLNDDDYDYDDDQDRKREKTSMDSDDSDYDQNSDLIKNPVMRRKLDIHKAVMAQKNKSIYDKNDEDDEDIGEIEVALEENFIEEVDEEYFGDEDLAEKQQKDKKQMDLKINEMEPNLSKEGDNISNNNKMDSDSDLIKPKTSVNNNADSEIESRKDFVKDFIDGIIQVAAAEVAESHSKNDNINKSDATKNDEIQMKNKEENEKIENEEEESNDIVPELLPFIQNTDLSKKYSIDLSNLEQRPALSTSHNNENIQEVDESAWQTILKHLVLAFIVYLVFKFLFGFIF